MKDGRVIMKGREFSGRFCRGKYCSAATEHAESIPEYGFAPTVRRKRYLGELRYFAGVLRVRRTASCQPAHLRRRVVTSMSG